MHNIPGKPPPPHTTPVWLEPGEHTTDSTRDTFTVGRCGRPTLSLKLGNTGFTSLADTKRLCSQSTGAA